MNMSHLSNQRITVIRVARGRHARSRRESKGSTVLYVQVWHEQVTTSFQVVIPNSPHVLVLTFNPVGLYCY